MNKHILSTIVCTIATISITAQTSMAPMSVKYRRSSLYTMIMVDPTSPYVEDIKSYFVNSPIPPKFNDHNLENRIYTVYLPEPKEMASIFLGGSKSGDVNAVADDFAKKNEKQLDDIAKKIYCQMV